jgi:hypothetical protein
MPTASGAKRYTRAEGWPWPFARSCSPLALLCYVLLFGRDRLMEVGCGAYSVFHSS